MIDEYLIIFGGCLLDLVCYNDLFFFNIRMREWSQPKITGDIPEARGGHAAVMFGSYLYIFGGSSKKGLLNDLY